MKKSLLIVFLILLTNKATAEINENIIQYLINTNNVSFNFEQNINGNIISIYEILNYIFIYFCCSFISY